MQTRQASARLARGEPSRVPDITDLFSRYRVDVARSVMKILGRNDGDAEDIVQEVFTVAWQRMGELREAESVRGWLLQIAVRRSLNFLRRRRIRAALILAHPYDYQSFAADAVAPEQQSFLVKLYQVLDRLPAKHRVAWVLRHLEGEELLAVAELCDCSVATVKRWLTSAQSRVEEAFRED